MASTYLYCIELAGAPIAKVGISKDPRHRLNSFAAACPFTMKFRRVFRFDCPDEASGVERHILVNANSHRDGGEWVRMDATLDALLSACPAPDVTEDFDFRVINGKRRRVAPERMRVNALRAQVGTKAARSTGYSGAATTYDAAVVKARLREGYGAQDVLVMDGIPEAFFWSVVRDLEAKGRLRPLMQPRLAAE